MGFRFTPMSTNFWSIFFLVYAFFQYEVITARDIASLMKESSSSVSSVLIFGDSTADSGNNNQIMTTVFKSNFSPYGKDFPNQTATGRFSNGRLANDFIAEYVGVKESIPAYLDPTLSIQDLKTGVSFASAGSGFDPLTPTISNVISLSRQLDYLKEYKAKLEEAIGKNETKEVIRNALFLVSAGTNDFIVNYYTLPIRRRTYTVQSYMNFVMTRERQFLQELYDEGARRIGVVGLPPMGCLPIVITLFADNSTTQRHCVANFSSIARDYNQILQKELNAVQLQVQPSGARIVYLDAYSPLEEMTSGHKYGFDVVNSGCCGTGKLEMGYLCNSGSAVCDDATKYVFWDSIHPTEKTYQLISKAFRPSIDYLVRS